MAPQFSRLERRPVTPEVTGSSPVGVAIKVYSRYLVAEKSGVEEETKESLYLATVFWL